MTAIVSLDSEDKRPVTVRALNPRLEVSPDDGIKLTFDLSELSDLADVTIYISGREDD